MKRQLTICLGLFLSSLFCSAGLYACIHVTLWPLQQMVLKTGVPHTEECNWRLTLCHTQKSTQMDRRLEHKAWNCETLRRKASLHSSWQWYHTCDTKSTGDKSKNRQAWIRQTKTLPPSKGKNLQNERTNYRKRGTAAGNVCGKGFTSKLYKELTQLNWENTNNPRWTHRLLSKETPMASRCVGRRPTQSGKWRNSLFCPKSINCLFFFFLE